MTEEQLNEMLGKIVTIYDGHTIIRASLGYFSGSFGVDEKTVACLFGPDDVKQIKMGTIALKQRG